MSEIEFIKDPEFQRLIPILSPENYNRLEGSLITKGCKKPIVVWGNIIVYDHNRYDICVKNKIQFQVKNKKFASREDVIRWVIAEHLANQDQYPVLYKYQIGKRYNIERAIAARIKRERNERRKDSDRNDSDKEPSEVAVCAYALAKEYDISQMALRNYREIAIAIDTIAEKDKRLSDKYLSGELRIKRDDLIAIADLPQGYIRALMNAIIRQGKTVCKSQDILDALSSKDLVLENRRERERRRSANIYSTQPSVKDMPAYDPDGEVASLSLTIPSWNSSIDRVFGNTDMSKISEKARNQLKHELMTLRDSIDLVLLAIEEEVNNGG